MADEYFTLDEVERHLREEVAEAGGAKKWLRKKGMRQIRLTWAS